MAVCSIKNAINGPENMGYFSGQKYFDHYCSVFLVIFVLMQNLEFF